MSTYTLFGVRGWGSVLAEAMLTLCGAPFQFEDVDGFDQPGAAQERLRTVNPLLQVPTLILPDGEIMTESVAITLLLSELHTDAKLAPAPGAAERAQFLRRLVWFGAAVYPTFTYYDYPERWAPSNQDELRRTVSARREELWRQFEAEIGEGSWVLGTAFSALDIFVGAMTRWRPRRDWFQAHAPRSFAIARAVDELPALKPVWERNFPA